MSSKAADTRNSTTRRMLRLGVALSAVLLLGGCYYHGAHGGYGGGYKGGSGYHGHNKGYGGAYRHSPGNPRYYYRGPRGGYYRGRKGRYYGDD